MVPSLVYAIAGLALAFVPLVLIEAYVFVQRLGVPVRRALIVSAATNAVAVFVAVPVAWLVAAAVAVLAVSRSSPGFASYVMSVFVFTGRADMVPSQVALLVLLPPFFVASWLGQYLLARRMLSKFERSLVNRAVVVSTAVSYVGLTGVLLVLYFTLH